MSLLEVVHGILEDAGIPHGLIGAVALALHGYPRATADTDLLTTSWAVLQDDLWQTLRGQGVEVEVRRGDDADPLAGVVVLRRGAEVVDIVVGRGAWQTELVARAGRKGRVPLVQLPDLILLKLHAGGNRDLRDVEDALPLLSESDVAAIEAGLVHLDEWSRGHWTRIRANAAGSDSDRP